VHYLTDVIAGVILGTTCGMLSVLFFTAIGLGV
jgi:membrane-associated phospholipid phosphatase